MNEENKNMGNTSKDTKMYYLDDDIQKIQV